MDWVEYQILLVVSLDLDEREQFNRFMLAGGNKKDFKWSSPDRAGTEVISDQAAFWAKTIARAGVSPMKGDIGRVATAGWKRITKVVEQMADGTSRTRYFDQDGADVTRRVELKISSGEYFMKTKMKIGE